VRNVQGVLQKTSTSTRSDFADWTNGISEPPWTIFERMVDLVIEYQSQQIRANREALNKWRATIRGKDSRQKKTPGVEVRRGSGAVEPEGNTA
jgi:hypothetical protein